MNMPLRRGYHLTERGGNGIACDENGLSLGGMDLAPVHRGAGGRVCCKVRAPGEISHILRAAYGPQADATVQRVHRGLCRAAAWVQAGDLGRAGIEAVMLSLPELAPGAMAKLAEIADLEKSANAPWETEPRLPAGHTGGGQWTTGGGAPAAAAAVNIPARSTPSRREPAQARPARKPPPHSPARLSGTGAATSAYGSAKPFETPDRSLLVHVNTAAVAIGGSGVAGDFALPAEVARLGRAGLLAFGAMLLDQWDAASAKKQINAAITRFGLDPSRLADVTAARAYVWSQYVLPFRTEAPFSGPQLDAASQAVMRFALVNPGAFAAMLASPTPQSAKTSGLVIAAAEGGLADYAAESRARPAGVAPELQTTSRRARAAIAEMLKTGKMAAHHLVPANVWEAKRGISDLATKDGWLPDDPSNLIALPTDMDSFTRSGGFLPLHIGSHPRYDSDTKSQIDFVQSTLPGPLTPLRARAILEVVSLQNRIRIMEGDYNPIVRAAK